MVYLSRFYGSNSHSFRLPHNCHYVHIYATDDHDIEVYITNHSFSLPFVPYVPLHISPGMQTRFVIKRVFERRLAAPYSECRTTTTGTAKIDQLNKDYYQSECFLFCVYYLIAENCSLLEELNQFSFLFYVDIDKFTGSFDKNVVKKCPGLNFSEAIGHYKRMGLPDKCQKINLCPEECNSNTITVTAQYLKRTRDR